MNGNIKSRLTVTGANIVFFTVAVLWILFQIVQLFLQSAYGEDFLSDRVYGVLIVNELIIVLSPVLVYLAAKRLNIREALRFNGLRPVPVLLIAAVSVPAYGVFAMLDTIAVFILQYIGDIPAQRLPVPKNAGELAVGILILSVLPAICEEMLHRGLLLRAYESRGSIKAVVIVSVFFGFFHFDIRNLIGPIFLGLLIGYYVIRTNSIIAGMLAHFFNNAIAEILQFMGRDVPAPNKMTVSAGELISSVTMGTICLVIVFLLMWLFRMATEGGYALKPALTSVRNDIRSITSHWPVVATFLFYIAVQLMFIFMIVIVRMKGFSY